MKKILFIHLPKCGGTSVGKAIRISYLRSTFFRRKKGIETIYAKPSRNGADLFEETLGVYRNKLLAYMLRVPYNVVIEGHIPFDSKIYENFAADWNYVTLLRDPVDRWYSEFFYHVKTRPEEFSHQLPTREYLESGYAQVSGTMYARFFSSNSELCSAFLDSDTQVKNNAGINWEDVVEQSKENLEKFALVGLLEDLNGFSRNFKKMFGRKLYIGHKNKNRIHNQERSTVDPDIHDKIVELCQPDLEIYNWVKKKLEQS